MFKKSELKSTEQIVTQQDPIKVEPDLDKDKAAQNRLEAFHMPTSALHDDEVEIVAILMSNDIFSDGSYLSMDAANNFFSDSPIEISQYSSNIDEANDGRTSPDKPVRTELEKQGIVNLFGAHNSYSFFQHNSEEYEDAVTSRLDKPAEPKPHYHLNPNDYEDASLPCLQL